MSRGFSFAKDGLADGSINAESLGKTVTKNGEMLKKYVQRDITFIIWRAIDGNLQFLRVAGLECNGPSAQANRAHFHCIRYRNRVHQHGDQTPSASILLNFFKRSGNGR